MKAFFVICLSYCIIASTYTSECGKMYDNNVSIEEQKLIVKKHNELRKLIANGKLPGQPRGINLKRMKYDETLAAEAQKIANTCVFAHKKVNDDRWAVGQNLYTYMSTGKSNGSDWASAIQSLFDEYKNYKYGRCCDSSSHTGHYTQVVWASSEYVGCGYTYFDTKQFFKYHKLYVCNYGPAGNYIGELPYKIGQSGCENLC